MQLLLANAKTMYSHTDSLPWSLPSFQTVANRLAAEMSTYDIGQLAQMLDCSMKLAADNWQRYQNFFDTSKMPAIMAYNGQAYKHLKAYSLESDALEFAQNHLWITCFLYGLLRPMDGIVPYRMEHCTFIRETGGRPVSGFWKNQITDFLIRIVQEYVGWLIHLSTEEYQHLFDWKRIIQEVKVIQPLFYTAQRDGSLKMQAVWAKSCRGAMVRYILTHHISHPEELQGFEYEGFQYDPSLGEKAFPHFIRTA